VSERLTLLMDAPPNLANARWHWHMKTRLKKKYWKAQDERQLVGLVEPPPSRPFERVSVHALFSLHNRMDPDNLHARLKWALDWLKSRGYIVNDSTKVIERLTVDQQIDRKRPGRLVLVIDAL